MADQSHNPLPGMPPVESPFFRQLFREGEHSPELLRIARDLHEKGFAVIDFPDPELPERADRLIQQLTPRFLEAGGGQLRPSTRLMDTWRELRDVHAVATNARVLELLAALYGRPAFPFQTLNFPLGTQQHFHSDAVHFHSIPERFMCGVWLALEDIGPDQGPLVYYPGSHRLPVYSLDQIRRSASEGKRHGQAIYEPLWRALVDEHGLKPEIFCARRGQALIWAANLLHGGMPHRDPARTRWSQVTHYYFADCAYYTPLQSEPFRGNIAFRRPTNILTSQLEGAHYNVRVMPSEFMAQAECNYWEELEQVEFDAAAHLRANPEVANVRPIRYESRVHYWRQSARY